MRIHKYTGCKEAHPEFDIYGTKGYLVDPLVMGTWTESRALCRAKGGDLVTVMDENESRSVRAFLHDGETTYRPLSWSMLPTNYPFFQ